MPCATLTITAPTVVVTITAVKLNPASVAQGGFSTVSATISNTGTASVSKSVRVSMDGVLVGVATVTVTVGSKDYTLLTVDTAGVSVGTHSICCEFS